MEHNKGKWIFDDPQVDVSTVGAYERLLVIFGRLDMAQYLKYKLARHGVEVKWTDVVPRVLGVVPRAEVIPLADEVPRQPEKI